MITCENIIREIVVFLIFLPVLISIYAVTYGLVNAIWNLIKKGN